MDMFWPESYQRVINFYLDDHIWSASGLQHINIILLLLIISHYLMLLYSGFPVDILLLSTALMMIMVLLTPQVLFPYSKSSWIIPIIYLLVNIMVTTFLVSFSSFLRSSPRSSILLFYECFCYKLWLQTSIIEYRTISVEVTTFNYSCLGSIHYKWRE